MVKRNYKISDVYDYLQQFYGLEWQRYLVKDGNNERSLRAEDFNDEHSHFYVIAIMLQGTKQKTVSLSVSNDRFEVYEIKPYLHRYNKPEVDWKEYLNVIYGNNQCLAR